MASRISALKDMGFSLAVISEILESYGNPTALSDYISLKRMEISEKAMETDRQLLLLDTAIERLIKDLRKVM